MFSVESSSLALLDPDTQATLEQLKTQLSPGQLLLCARALLDWLAPEALLSNELSVAVEPAPRDQNGLTILFASHTGHSASIAKRLGERLRDRGHVCDIHDLATFPRASLRRLRKVAVITSTHGEGQPPESAAEFFEYLFGERAPTLRDCEYAVLGLGDQNYLKYCQAAVDLDRRLGELGGARLLERVDLDVDYEDGATAWMKLVCDTFAGELRPSVATGVGAAARTPPRRGWLHIDREHPFSAELLERTILSGCGSTQCFAHLELSLVDSQLKYEPGDAVGLKFENQPELVEALITALGADREHRVSIDGTDLTLGEALTHRRELRHIAGSALRKYATLTGACPGELLSDPEATRTYLWGRDWLDILLEHPSAISPSEFVELLGELGSRSYSIASYQGVHPEEVQLLVSRVGYPLKGRIRLGGASSYLTDRLAIGQSVKLWIEPNRSFRLPTDPTQPIIMIAAGTGVAPFRAFIEARQAQGVRGPSWLLFGNRNFLSDFTYQVEWQRWLADGSLTRMDVAFSRDGHQKRYVTHLLAEQGKELYAWLERGALVYLCGDRAKLGNACDQALLAAVSEHGGRSEKGALEYLEQLKSQGRYRKDVY